MIAQNFKGGSWKTPLSPVTVVAGPSARGKSSRLEAVTLALCGQLPGIATRPGDVHERLASDKSMVVTAEFEGDKWITRSWLEGRNGSVSTQVGVQGLADGFTVPTSLFDQTEFLGLSARERTRALFRVLPPPDLTKVGPDVVVTNLKNLKLEEHTPEVENAINLLCEWVRKSWTDTVVTAKLPVQDWLSAITETAKEKANQATAAAKRMAETILGVTQLKSPDAASLAAAENLATTRRKELEAAQEVLTNLEGDLNKARTEYRETKRVADSKPAGDVEATNKALVALDLTPISPRENRGPALTKVVKERREAFGKAELALTNYTNAKVKLEKMIEDAKNTQQCPHCGQSVEQLQKVIVERLTKELEESASVGVTFTKLAEYAEQELEAVEKNLADFNEEQESYITSLNALTARQNQAEEYREGLERVAVINAESSAAILRLPGLEEKGRTFNRLVGEATTKRDTARTASEEADKAHKLAVADAASARQSAKAREEHAKAKAEADVGKKLFEMLVELTRTCVEQTVGTLVATCNRLANPVLLTPLVLEDGELGLKRDGRFITWRACSDGEQTVMTAALRLGLAVTSPIKLAVVARLESLDSDRRYTLVKCCLDLVREGTLEQAILIQVSDGEPREYQGLNDDKNFTCVVV